MAFPTFSSRRGTLAAVTVLLSLVGVAHAQDFNGDLIPDLAIGVPGEDIGAIVDAGEVRVIYGAGPGFGLDPIFPLPTVTISQTGYGIEVDEMGDRFGESLAWGDFNGDGFDDLAIGIPGEDVGLAIDCGAVAVLYGSPGGLIVAGPPWFIQTMLITPDPDETGDVFGAALAVGNFDADPFDDLAIGAPGEDPPAGPVDAGQVYVLHGFPPGIFPGFPAPLPIMVQGVFGLDLTEAGDAFGGTLCVGDFDGDGADDLAIATELEDIGANVDCGGVTVAYGVTGLGLPPFGAQWWNQNSPGINDACQAGDRFGAAMASGDFTFDGAEDLAVGVPGESIGAAIGTGAVNVIHGSTALGLDAFIIPDQFWHQNVAGVPSNNATGDEFGAALAVGWTDGPFGFHYLAIGVPGDNVAAVNDTGSVIVIYPTLAPGGLSVAGVTLPEIWHQNTAGIPDNNSMGDRFGSSLSVGDFDTNLCQDLVVGVPSEDIGAAADCGGINVIYGSFIPGIHLDAFAAVPAEFWSQSLLGGVNEAADGMGSSLDRP